MNTCTETVKRKPFTEIPRADRDRYVRVIPLPTTLKTRVVQHFDSWVSKNGYSWAVSRMKAFRQFIMNYRASNGNTPNPDWFTTNRCQVLDGDFGYLLKLSKQSTPKFRAVLDLTGIYTTVTYTEEIDTAVIRKELESIETLVPDHPKLTNLQSKTLRRMMQRWVTEWVVAEKPTPLTEVPPGKLSHKDTTPYDVWMLSQWIQFSPDPIKRLVESAVGGPRIATPMFSVDVTSINAGEIHATMEPGLKIRYFANPNKALQRSMEPLKRGLFRLLKQLPWDCTLNQRKADKFITQKLKEGSTVYSVDLSSATDRFPYWFQKVVLKAVMPRNMNQKKTLKGSLALLDLMVEKGKYYHKGCGYTWKTGQPMGINPSFPLFTLSHGALLLALNRGKWERAFYVCGDDVIIFDKSLYQLYMKVLNSWEVPVSESKSFSSSRLAQFTGVTYTPDGSFWLPKWRAIHRGTLVDIAAFWYQGFTKGLKDHDLITRVLSLPSPYGIGRNPMGIPLDQRFTDDLVNKLVEMEVVGEKKAMPSHTKRYIGYDSPYSYHWFNDWKPHLSNRKIRISPKFDPLMDQTEVWGYPKLRLHIPGKKDVYTLGRTQYWNKLFQSVDSLSET